VLVEFALREIEFPCAGEVGLRGGLRECGAGKSGASVKSGRCMAFTCRDCNTAGRGLGSARCGVQ
jgi:hypothetical protein